MFYICSNCGFGSGSWIGKCPDCGKWNTLKEQPNFEKSSKERSEAVKKITITSLSKVKNSKKSRLSTGIYEFDRVLGGGVVPGEVILLTGQPGIGKSTLVLQAFQKLKVLYISGEESAEQVKNRAERLSVNLDNLSFSADLQIESIIGSLDELKNEIEIVIIDSIQTIYSKDVEGPVAGVSQLKEVTKKIVNFAKQSNLPILLIGHINKEGEIAGPKTLEHFVDCVLEIEGEKVSNFRLLRASKNRFGSTDEIGIFEMKQKGMSEVKNPLVFLETEKKLEPGKAIVGVSEGNRPFFFEIQTLVVPTNFMNPRRVVKGLDFNKVQLLLAVVKKNINLPLDRYDVFVNVVGGVSIKSTAADLGLIASLISSFKNIALPANSLFIGEVGLLGEIRPSYMEEKIIEESKRLGFKKIYSSKLIKSVKEFNSVIPVKTGIHGSPPTRG
ncbi:MAG: DNA repair protein RadA [Candidatus Roizmanbacteria bacterium]|nr:DNA repair protein RadA [Candidatus Roizmanbacteria bacterium]